MPSSGNSEISPSLKACNNEKVAGLGGHQEGKEASAAFNLQPLRRCLPRLQQRPRPPRTQHNISGRPLSLEAYNLTGRFFFMYVELVVSTTSNMYTRHSFSRNFDISPQISYLFQAFWRCDVTSFVNAPLVLAKLLIDYEQCFFTWT